MKPYRTGILVGRFQVLHLGHADMIRKALSLCEEVAVFVGSSQESRTERNPFTYEERRDALLTLFPEGLKVFPLPDIGVGNCSAWGEYVLKNVREKLGCLPDLLITGKEERRAAWYDCTEGRGIAELHVPKSVEISASRLREALAAGEREFWQSYMSPLLWDRFEQMRQIVLSCRGNTVTASL